MVKDHFPKFSRLFMRSGAPYDGETENFKWCCLSRPPVVLQICWFCQEQKRHYKIRCFSCLLFSIPASAQHIRNKTGPLRSLTGNILDNYFVEYGCWCYYGDEHGSFKGRGEPVDQWDTFCKELNQGYECAYMDAQARGDTACEPWNEQFGRRQIQKL